MMDRRRFLLTSVAGALAKPLIAETQQTGKVARVGTLNHGERLTAAQFASNPLRDALRDLGWVQGQSIVFEYRQTLTVDGLDALAAELVNLNVDVIYAGTGAGIRAAMRATKTIPIVMIAGGDPVASGFVASLARPGGNVTGVAAILGELTGYRVGLIKETLPGISRVAYLSNRTNPGNVGSVAEVTRAAQKDGLVVLSFPVSGPEDFESAFARLMKERVGAVWVAPDGLLSAHRIRLAGLAAKHRVPSFYALREHVEAGGLMSYSPAWSALVRRAAVYIDKILRGAQPSDLPVEQPTHFDLVINLKTAKALGLTIPPSLLLRADQVIE